MGVITDLDIAALIRVGDAPTLTRFLKYLVGLQMGGVQGSGFEGNTVQYFSVDQIQTLIRTIEATLQQLEAGNAPSQTVRNILYADPRRGNPYR